MRTPVLIVGGGPTGLTLSILLTGYGVDHLLVEARPEVSRHPKARGVSARSMEIFRRCGVADEIVAAALPASTVRFFRGRSLTDPEATLHPAPSDSGGLICAQDVLEPILAARTEIRRGARLISVTPDGVCALSTGDTVEADWIVGCDGAASTVRTAAGIGFDGPTGLAEFLSVRFDAPLGEVVADRASASYFLTGPGGGGFLAVDNDRRWIYQCPLPDDDLDLVTRIRAAAGIDDLAVSIRDTLVWRMDAQLAAAYRRGRMLLAGDAAHTVPPTGGHGMNTGIGDADNLAWKLAAVAHGEAPESLLDTYQAERRPIGRAVIDISLANAAARGGYRIDDELLLSAVYRSTAVLGGSPGETSALAPGGYTPAWLPGHRAPDAPRSGEFSLAHNDSGTCLIRPDDHIAWRGETRPTAGELASLRTRILHGT